jgi:NAD(P)-dependent dehydrogenase (short-subunit alcohol dehydrogenase family)
MKSFAGKVAAITGAGSGIGRSLALALARERCDLALSDIDEAGLAETANLVSGLGVRTTTTRVDVSDREAVHAWADEAARQHRKINLIFNNAGVALGTTLEGVDYEDFEWIVGINFWGVVYGTKAFLPHLRASGEGHVVNISSVFGLMGVPTQGTYNATKFAVRGFTEALRQELDLAKAPVSATCIHPGGIRTNIAKSSRMSASLGQLTPKDTYAARAVMERMFITSSEEAAAGILQAVRANKRRALIGPDAYAIDFAVRLSPETAQSVVSTLARWMA